MVLIYFGAGVFIILSNWTFVGFSEFNKKLFGILLIVYSFYRGYRFWRKFVKNEDEATE